MGRCSSFGFCFHREDCDDACRIPAWSLIFMVYGVCRRFVLRRPRRTFATSYSAVSIILCSLNYSTAAEREVAMKLLKLTKVFCLFAIIIASSEAVLAQQATRTRIIAQLGHGGGISSVSFSNDGALAVSGDDQGAVFVWDLKTGRTLKALRKDSDPVRSVRFRWTESECW